MKSRTLALSSSDDTFGIKFVYQERIIHPIIVPEVNALTISQNSHGSFSEIPMVHNIFQALEFMSGLLIWRIFILFLRHFVFINWTGIFWLSQYVPTLFAGKAVLTSSVFPIPHPPSYFGMSMLTQAFVLYKMLIIIYIHVYYCSRKLYVCTIYVFAHKFGILNQSMEY